MVQPGRNGSCSPNFTVVTAAYLVHAGLVRSQTSNESPN
jgi:hypothetical protein